MKVSCDNITDTDKNSSKWEKRKKEVYRIIIGIVVYLLFTGGSSLLASSNVEIAKLSSEQMVVYFILRFIGIFGGILILWGVKNLIQLSDYPE